MTTRGSMARGILAAAVLLICRCQYVSDVGTACADSVPCPPGLACDPGGHCQLSNGDGADAGNGGDGGSSVMDGGNGGDAGPSPASQR